MALFNESLEGRFNRLITRMHGTRGAAPAPQIAPEINHGITLENDRPEQLHHQDTFLWAARITSAAQALNVSHVGIRNPTGSGLLVVITSIQVSNAAAVAITADLNTRAQAAIQSTLTTFYRDSRRGFGGNCPVLAISDNTGTVALGAGPLERVALLAGQSDEAFTSVPYVLTPGFEILVHPSIVNLAIDCDFSGYARALATQDLFSA